MPLAHMGGVPHRIMGFEVETCKARLTQLNHPLLNFFCHTHHSDLDVVRANKTPMNHVLRQVHNGQTVAFAN